jgi:acyl-[acyl carrier protein]--UDP-N-acetylglucosamine O-acyltransferase
MMGGVGVHHFARIGKFCFIGGYARIHHDAPPFCKLDGADESAAQHRRLLCPASATTTSPP